MSDSGAPAATSADDTASVRGVALGWAKVAVSITIPAISAAASVPSPASSGTPSRAARSVTISHVAAAPGSIQSAGAAVGVRGVVVDDHPRQRGEQLRVPLCDRPDAVRRAAVDEHQQVVVGAGSGSVRNRSTPAMNAYSGGTGSVDTAVARAAARLEDARTRRAGAERVGIRVLVAHDERVAAPRSAAPGRVRDGVTRERREVDRVGHARFGARRGVLAARRGRRAGRRVRDGSSAGARAWPRRWPRHGRPRRPDPSRSSPSWGSRWTGFGSDSWYGAIVSGSLPSSSSWSRWRTRVPRSAVSSRWTWRAGMRLIRSVRPSSWRMNPIACWSARSVSFWSACRRSR